MRHALPPTMSLRTTAFAAAAGAALISGCTIGSEGDGLGERLGITAQSPDEFLIIARKPLELPPSFTLPTPQPGAPSRVAENPLTKAQTALLQTPERPRLAAASTGERALLSGAGAAGDNSAIREALADEGLPEGERKFGLTSLFGYQIPADISEADSVLKSREEEELLKSHGLRTPAAPPIEEDD